MKLQMLPLVACIFLISFHCTASSKLPGHHLRLRATDSARTSNSLDSDSHSNKGKTNSNFIPSDYAVVTLDSGMALAFKFHSTKKTWNQARKTCHQEGAYLAYVDTAIEGRLYHETLKQKNSGGAWIGMHDLFEEGDWVTVLGESESELLYVNWAPSEPNNYGINGEHCAELQIDGRLYDMPCDKKLFFFCKMYRRNN